MNIEIERKFLVNGDSYKESSFASERICQGYICSERGRTVRIRQLQMADRDGNVQESHAYITIKGPSPDGGLSRYEFEQEIPLEDAQKLMTLCEPGVIDKTRWLVRSGEHVFEVDEFHGENDGLVMAEVELKSPDEEPKMPHFIGKEVTGDRRYNNSQLRRNPYKLWGNIYSRTSLLLTSPLSLTNPAFPPTFCFPNPNLNSSSCPLVVRLLSACCPVVVR